MVSWKTTDVKWHSHHIISQYTLFTGPNIVADLDLLAEVVFVKFLPCKVTLSFLLPSVSSLERSHYMQPTFRAWRIPLHLFKGK